MPSPPPSFISLPPPPPSSPTSMDRDNPLVSPAGSSTSTSSSYPSAPNLSTAASRLFPIRSVKYPSTPPSASSSYFARGGEPTSPTHQHTSPPLRQSWDEDGRWRRNSVITPRDSRSDEGELEDEDEATGSRTSIVGASIQSDVLMTTRFEHTTTEDGGNWVLTGREGQIERCEDEPIHAPGAIQAFGVALCFDEEPNGDLRVQQVSENCRQILRVSPSAILRSSSLYDVLPASARGYIEEGLETLEERDMDPTNTDSSPIYFLLVTELWSAHCALHSPDPIEKPNRKVLELELLGDKINPLTERHRGTEENVNFIRGGMERDGSENEGEVYDEDDVEKSTIGLAKPLRALGRWRRTGGEMDIVAVLSQINDQLDKADELEKFLRIVAGIFKELTEFDRVMVYQFDEQWNGQVVAEQVDWTRTKDLFRGLNFPATDIPVQARELYKLNKVRLLYDRSQPTARMCCRSLEEVQNPLNMTHCHLRAMSPIHIKYLGNMGVKSSMSISVTAFGDLWGLVALHGYGDYGHRVSFPVRQLCRLLGDSISRNIERLSYAKRLHARKLINTTPTNVNPSGYIVARAEDLLHLFDADFGVLGIGEEAKILGPVENSQELLAILAYLRSRQLQSIVMTQDLSTDFPDIDYSGKFELIAGFLTVPLSSEGKDFIVFFRKGQLQEVHWAGYPHANKTANDYRPLEPRKSFKTWSEIVVGKCRAWTDEQVETAGVLCLVYGKFIDVWRQKESALAANQLTNLLLANASHEVRTPLNAIINYLELALDGPVDGEVRENLARSHAASRSLIHVINDLLDLTRTEKGNDLSLTDPFDLPATLQDAISVHRAEAVRRGLTVDIVESPSGTPPILMGDRGKVKQIVANIVSNAVKHTDNGGVTVEWGELVDADMEDAADKRKDSIRIGISITDTGCGLSEADLESIFREFEQVSTVDHHPSMPMATVGLGLAVVARIVRNLNGQLRVESKVGEGSKFTVILPFRLPTSFGLPDRRSSLLPVDDTPDGSGTGSSKTISVADSGGIPISSTKIVRANSYGSASSLNSKGSKGSSTKSEIDDLINAMSSSHMDPRRTRPPITTSASSGAIKPSGRSGAAGNPRAPKAGQIEVEDSNVPLRPVRVQPHTDGPDQAGGVLGRRRLSAQPDENSNASITLPPALCASASSRSSLSSPAPPLPPSPSPSPAPSVPSDDSFKSTLTAPPPVTPPESAGSSSNPPLINSPSHVSKFRVSPKASAVQTPPSARLRILVVEDELVNRLILVKRLVKCGHKVVTAEHGGDAVRLLEQELDGFDLVLMDLMMPIMNGYEASAAIRALESTATAGVPTRAPTLLNGRIPILAVSASLLERQREQIASVGIDGWLLKPVDSKRLFRLIEGSLDRWKRSEDVYRPGAWEKGGWLDEAPTLRTRDTK